VKLTDEYIIPFHGIKEGTREYEFDVSSGFFEYSHNPDYRGGDLKVRVLVSKKPQFFELGINIDEYIKVLCDRCLEELSLPVSVNEMLIVKFGETFEEPDDNILIIPREETRVNIAQYIYEFAVLSLPVRRVHTEINGIGGCNPEMIKILEEHSEDNNKDTDPRWDKLKKIISIN
jgi:uncharacterized metal-binding protein YceD (DUF177 family)